MSSLADLPDLVGFFSYSRSDDEQSDGALTGLRQRIRRELRMQLGRELRLWQDTEAIPLGTLWEGEIRKAIAESAFFIPIVSPSALNSGFCRTEFEAFLAREAALGRNDLVFPILYIPVPGIANADRPVRDEVLKIIHARQYADWTEIRVDDVDSPGVKREVARFSKGIVAALRKVRESPDGRRRLAQAEAQRQAEAVQHYEGTGKSALGPAKRDVGAGRESRFSLRVLAGLGVFGGIVVIGAVIVGLAIPRLALWPLLPQQTSSPPEPARPEPIPPASNPPVPEFKTATNSPPLPLVVDASGSCPRDEDFQRFNPEIDGTVASQRRRTGSPVRSDVSLYRNSSLTGTGVEKPPSRYDDDVVVMVGAKLGATGPALVRRIRDNVCGWMDVRDLESSASVPLKLTQLPGFGNVQDGLRLPDRLDARVVVKNRLDPYTGVSQRAPLFNAPFDGPEPPPAQWRGDVGFFEVLSVFDVRRNNGLCRSIHEEGCFLRVGTTLDVGSGNSSGGKRIRGWMLGRDLEVWPSALAVYYKPGKEGLKVHATEASARNGTPYADPGVPTRVLALQPPGRYAEPRDLNIMRFPVISATPAGPQRPASRPGEQAATPYVYEILFTGRACVIGGDDCIPEPQVKAEIAMLGKATRMLSNVDVLFVVDTTESMAPYLRAAAAAIKKQVDDLATTGDASLRHSIVLYGDYNETRADGLDYFALPFSPVNDRSGIERLQNVKPYDDIHKDLPGAPFAALERAISQAKWRPDAAQRLVIWIGGRGNRPPGTYRTNAGYALVEDKTAQNVIAAIRAVDERMKSTSAIGVGTRTRFVALQVKGGPRVSRQEEFVKFRTDAKAISDALGGDIFQTIPAPNNISREAEVAKLTDAIAAQIALSVKAATRTRDAVAAALGGDATGLQSSLPESQLTRDYLQQLGFGVERLVEIGKRIQVVQTGYVFQNGADGDFRYWLALRRPELSELRTSVNDLCENMPYSDAAPSIEDAILKMVKALTSGDPQPGERLRDYYSRVFDIPVNHISTVLDGTPDQFLRRLNQASERAILVTKVCRSAKLLNMIAEGQIVDNPEQDIVITTQGAVVRPGLAPRPFDWRWISPDTLSEWFFVPMDYLP
jgi:hypothetical protein